LWQVVVSSAPGHTLTFKHAARGLTLLSFWATWYLPCHEELLRLTAQRTSKPRVRAFWKANRLSSPPLAFARSRDLSAWPLPGLLTSVLLDAVGSVQALRFGPLTAQELENWVR